MGGSAERVRKPIQAGEIASVGWMSTVTGTFVSPFRSVVSQQDLHEALEVVTTEEGDFDLPGFSSSDLDADGGPQPALQLRFESPDVGVGPG